MRTRAAAAPATSRPLRPSRLWGRRVLAAASTLALVGPTITTAPASASVLDSLSALTSFSSGEDTDAPPSGTVTRNPSDDRSAGSHPSTVGPRTGTAYYDGYHNINDWRWTADPGYIFPGARVINITKRKACTVGWIVKAGRYSYILTAGHCGNPGDTFTVMFPDGDSTTIGKLTHSEFINGSRDWALIRLVPTIRVSPRVPDRGPLLHSVRQLPPINASTLRVGDTIICHLGARTGLSCGAYTGTDRDGMVHAFGTINHGDSGGPAFVLGDGVLYPLGVVSAAPRTGATEISIQPITPILDEWTLRFVD